jgi:hypothetical protein
LAERSSKRRHPPPEGLKQNMTRLMEGEVDEVKETAARIIYLRKGVDDAKQERTITKRKGGYPDLAEIC